MSDKLFVLGSGFSKAVRPVMPVLSDLAKHLHLEDSWAEFRADAFLYDVETLLTFLFQDHPWKMPEEYHKDRAEYYRIARDIADYIGDCERRAFLEAPPPWAVDFIEYLTKNRCPVISLNYDTVVERLFEHLYKKQGDPRRLYQMPITYVEMRSQTMVGFHDDPAFPLTKLHGSTNWLYQGGEDAAGQSVFLTKDRPKREEQRLANEIDLEPMIIPPIIEKTPFYGLRIVRSLWRRFSEQFWGAKEVYFVGYSLPVSDVPIQIFLKDHFSPSRTTFVVKAVTGTEAPRLLDRYRTCVSPAHIDERYLGGDDCVQRMCVDLLNA